MGGGSQELLSEEVESRKCRNVQHDPPKSLLLKVLDLELGHLLVPCTIRQELTRVSYVQETYTEYIPILRLRRDSAGVML